MRTFNSEIQQLQRDLETAFPDRMWLKLLELFLPSGVADTAHMGAGLGMNRDKLSRFLNKIEGTSAGYSPIIRLIDHSLKRPTGTPGKPHHIYLLDASGAELLNANGHPGTRTCNLKSDREINHALGMVSFHMAAQEADLQVITDTQIPYGDQKAIRPDHRIPLADGHFLLYEIEQDIKRALIPRVMESLSNKQAFFLSKESSPYLPEVRMLINLPRGTKFNQTLNIWRECFKLLVEQLKTDVSFRLLAMPLGEFLKEPNWVTEVTDAWKELNALSETDEEDSNQQSNDPLTPYEQNRSAERDNVVLQALLQGYKESERLDLPKRDFGMFDVVYTIYSASNPDNCYSSSLPQASIYIFKCYLEMHPTLLKWLRATLHQGKGHIRWNHVTIMHRMQLVINCFLRYHGWQHGGTIKVKAVNDGWEGPGNFGVVVEELNIKFGNEVEWKSEYVIYRALAWVLWAIFEYADDLGLGRPEFW